MQPPNPYNPANPDKPKKSKYFKTFLNAPTANNAPNPQDNPTPNSQANADTMTNPRTGKTLQQELIAYNKALEEEWGTDPNSPSSYASADLAAKTKRMLLDGTPHAISTLVYLAAHSPVDGVRASCAKFIVENALGNKAKGGEESTLDKLLREFNEQAARTDSADNT
jgi:hypothetical protein